MRRLLIASLALSSLVAMLPAAASAQTYTITSAADAVAADGVCTLREAILSSNAGSAVGGCAKGDGGDTIVLAVPKVTLARPGASEDAGQTGDLDVTGTLTIRGAAGGTVLDGAQLDRVLDVGVNGQLTLQDVTVTHGLTPDGAGGASAGAAGAPGQDGGGIRSAGGLTLQGVTVTANQTGHGGNGVAQSATGTYFTDGGAGGHGGDGGGVAAGGALVLSASTISANVTGGGGTGGAATAGGQTGLLEGGAAYSGRGGRGGAGGGIAVSGPSSTIADATVVGNTTGAGATSAVAHGGAGVSTTSGTAGAGGDGTGGSGGDGGYGGGIAFLSSGRADVRSSLIADNHTGPGAAGVAGFGGAGGNGSDAGTGTGTGGAGGIGFGGSGGKGGYGGGVAAGVEYTDQQDVRLSAVTITRNTTGDGADGGGAYGAPGGRGASGKPGGHGGSAFQGIGGDAGLGAGVSGGVYSAPSVRSATIVGNGASAGFGRIGPGVPGFGGTGTPAGADGGLAVGVHDGATGGGGLRTYATADLRDSIVAANTPDQCQTVTTADTGATGNIGFPSDPMENCPGALVVNPALRPLDGRGGATPTFGLLPGSPAIDAVLADDDCSATDGRGVGRPVGARCDIGAYEAAPPGVTAGAASLATVSAVVPGTVDARRGATAVHVVWGVAAGAYGSASADVAVAGGTSGAVAVSFAIGGLAAGTTYHYALVGTGLDGTTRTADRTFTTAGGGGGAGAGGGVGGGGAGTGGGGSGAGPGATGPVLTRLALKPSTFRVQTKRLRKGRGTTISWTDSAAATVTFTVARRATGVRKGTACIARPTGKPKRTAKPCTRWIAVKGSLKHIDKKAGANTLHWSGTIGSHTLTSGHYRLNAQARQAATAGKAITRTFTVRR